MNTTKLFSFLVIVFCLLVMPVSADYEIDGTVEYQSSVSNSYTLPSGSGNYATGILYGNITHRFTDAKEIYIIKMSGNIYYTDTAFSRASAFTATVDDVYYGAGVASIYNSNGDPVYKVVFDSVDSDYAKTLTGVKSVILDINNISKFNGISLTDYNRHSSAALSSNSTTSVRCPVTAGGEGNFAADYVTSYNTYYYNDYTYTYTESTNYFLLNVDKLGYTSQLSVLNSTGGVYTQDDAYTTTPLEVYSNFNNGVILSSKFDVYGGVYVNTTLHTEDTETYQPPTLPTSYSNVLWYEDSYYADEIGQIGYFIHNDDWLDTYLGYGYTFYLNYKDSSETAYNSIRLTSESGSKYITFKESDNFITATLTKHLNDGQTALFTTTLDTDTVNIYQRDKTGSITTNVTETTTGSDFNITYKYDYAVTSPVISIKRLVDGVWSDDTLGMISISNYVVDTEYNITHSIAQEGKYLLELRDAGTVLAARVINIVFIINPPTQNITLSFIDTDKSTYQIGSRIKTDFAIDNTNYSSYAAFLEVYNNDYGILSYRIPVYSQIDNHWIRLGEDKNIDTNWGFFVIDTPKFYSGSNTIRLSGYDLTTGEYNLNIVSKNITIDIVTTSGYGLTVSDNAITVGDRVIINYIVPSASTLKIIRTSTQEIIKTVEINTSDSFSYTFEDFGIYDIELHSTNYLEVTTQIIVSDIDIVDEIEDDDVAFDTSFESMLSSDAFIALLIIIACVGAFGKIGGVVGVFLGMVVGISLSFLMGYLPPWILFIMVLALCVVFVSKLINSFGGGE